jgi:hypothetical protein
MGVELEHKAYQNKCYIFLVGAATLLLQENPATAQKSPASAKSLLSLLLALEARFALLK